MDVEGLIGKLQAFANGCRGSMWQSRNETITLMDKAAEALSRQKAAGDDAIRALRWLRAFWQPGSNHDTQEVQDALSSADAALTAWNSIEQGDGA